ACAARLDDGLADFRTQVGEFDADKHRILFVTHSIPNVMQDASAVATNGYLAQHEELMANLLGRLDEADRLPAGVVYCSRSAPPGVARLGDDVSDRMTELAEEGVTGGVLVPIGFIYGHMEVVYDLDTEAKETADGLGFGFTRVGTVGTHEALVSGLVDLVEARIGPLRSEEHTSELQS